MSLCWSAFCLNTYCSTWMCFSFAQLFCTSVKTKYWCWPDSLVPDVRALACVGGASINLLRARLCSPHPRTQEPGRLVRGYWPELFVEKGTWSSKTYLELVQHVSNCGSAHNILQKSYDNIITSFLLSIVCSYLISWFSCQSSIFCVLQFHKMLDFRTQLGHVCKLSLAAYSTPVPAPARFFGKHPYGVASAAP